VGSDIGGIPEAVEHGRTGTCVPPGDEEALRRALERFLCDTCFGRAAGLAGRRRCEERFSLERQAQLVEKLYEELMAEAAR
jgi:glycosyltransferase involved in cell wall biosynthesis